MTSNVPENLRLYVQDRTRKLREIFIDKREIEGGGGGVLYTNENPVPEDIGGIHAGETFDQVTVQEIFDKLLYPTLTPTLTGPSFTFSSNVEQYYEIGYIVPSITFTTTFNRGSISPAYGTSGYRSGLPTKYNYTGAGLTPIEKIALADTQTITNVEITAGRKSWSASVSYGVGEQPKDSVGNNYMSPLPAGTTATRTATTEGVYPVFATTSSISSMTKQALKSMSSEYISISFVAETDTEKQTIDFPGLWSEITGVQFYNTLTQNWDWISGNKALSLKTFTNSATTHVVQGNEVAYVRYTHNSSKTGARELRFYTT